MADDPIAQQYCTCLSISRDPLCVYHGDVDKVAGLRAGPPADDPIARLIQRWRNDADYDPDQASAYTWSKCASELEAAVQAALRASPPPDEGITTLIESLEGRSEAYSGITKKCEECSQLNGHHFDWCICYLLLGTAKFLRAVRDGRREEPAK